LADVGFGNIFYRFGLSLRDNKATRVVAGWTYINHLIRSLNQIKIMFDEQETAAIVTCGPNHSNSLAYNIFSKPPP
jgi:hypothetical protein